MPFPSLAARPPVSMARSLLLIPPVNDSALLKLRRLDVILLDQSITFERTTAEIAASDTRLAASGT